MSGHSKWSNIKNKKEKTDAQRGKIFTKIGKEIAIAVRAGGPDPASNNKLRDAIAKALMKVTVLPVLQSLLQQQRTIGIVLAGKCDISSTNTVEIWGKVAAYLLCSTTRVSSLLRKQTASMKTR